MSRAQNRPFREWPLLGRKANLLMREADFAVERKADIRPGIDIDYPSCGTSPPRGPLSKAGTGLKDHGWFMLPISKQAHDEYADSVAWDTALVLSYSLRFGPR